MLQNLLIDRFRLEMRRERRAMKVLVLRIAAGGPKIVAALPASGPAAAPVALRFDLDRDGFVIVPPGQTRSSRSRDLTESAG